MKSVTSRGGSTSFLGGNDRNVTSFIEDDALMDELEIGSPAIETPKTTVAKTIELSDDDDDDDLPF